MAAVVAGIGLAGAGQNPTPDEPRVQILSPGEGAYVSGPTLLRVRIDPPGGITSVIFSIDGRQVCGMSKPPWECEWDAGPMVAEHLVRVAVNLTGERPRLVQTIRTKSLGYTEKVDVDVVQVTVTVTDGRGKYIKGLPRSVFHVAEDGRPQTISHFESEDVPLELLVAVDISGSMTPAMPKLKQAVKEFLFAVPARDKVTLLGFNDTVFPVMRKSTDPAERAKGVDRLAPWGSTALYDVILQGIQMLGRETGRKALIVFTDGEDQGSHATIADVERRLQSSDLTLYMIAQGRGITSDSLKRIMLRLSVPTGGRALFTDSIDELHEAFDELLEELSNQYLLGYPPINARRDETWRRIKVDVDGYNQVRARQGYLAAASGK